MSASNPESSLLPSSDVNKDEAIASIKVLLSSLDSFVHTPSADVNTFLENFGGMETIFWFIINVPSQQSLLSRALSRIFAGSAGISRLLSPELLPILTTGLQHHYEHVVLITLQTLQFMGTSDEGQQYLQSSSLYPLLLQLLHSPHLSIVSLASDIIQQLATRKDENVKLFFGKSVQDLITSASSSLYSLRALSLCTSIALTSDTAYTAYVNAGLVDILFSSLHHQDVLMQLNVMELMGKLGSTGTGLATLTQHNIGKHILDIIHAGKQNMLTVGGLKLWGILANASKQHQSHTWYQTSDIHEFLSIQVSDDNDNDVVKAEAISTTCEFGASAEGLGWLAQPVSPALSSLHTHENPSGCPLFAIPAYVISTSELLQMTTLHGFVNILEQRYDSDSPQHHTARALQQQTFQAIATYRGGGHSSLGVLRSYLSTPFADLRVACYRVCSAIAYHDWGLRMMCVEAGWLEYILDRSTEIYGKLGLELKYEIICHIVENPRFHDIITTHVSVELKKEILEYKVKGPFYQQRVALVENPQTKGAEQ